MSKKEATTHRVSKPRKPRYDVKEGVLYFMKAKKSKTEPLWALANFAALPVTVRGKKHKTSEHAYQSWKFDYEGNSDVNKEFVETLAQTKGPGICKHLVYLKDSGFYSWTKDPWLVGQVEKYKLNPPTLDPTFHENKEKYMEEILRAKVDQHTFIKDLLLSTGDNELAEANTKDPVWGIGKDGKGENKLGKLWVKIRDELKQS